MRSILHIVAACIAAFVGLALLMAVFYAVSFAVFGLLAVLMGVHPALGYAYSASLFAVALVFIVRDIRKGGQHGKA